MSQHLYYPASNGQEINLTPGAVSGLLYGMGAGSLLIEGWDGAAWVTLQTLTPAQSGVIGGVAITVPASGRIRATWSGYSLPAQCRLSI